MYEKKRLLGFCGNCSDVAEGKESSEMEGAFEDPAMKDDFLQERALHSRNSVDSLRWNLRMKGMTLCRVDLVSWIAVPLKMGL